MNLPAQTKKPPPQARGLCECGGCPFWGPAVGNKGPLDSPVVFVGESPGKHELRDKIPFVGPSGAILDDVSQRTKLPFEIFYTNAIQCYPGNSDDKTPADMMQAVQACQPRLHQELAAHPRKVILALGAAAAWSLTGDWGLKITKARGTLYKSPFAEIGVLATIHPAFLMRGGGSLRQFRADVDYALSLAMGGPLRQSGTSTWEELKDEGDILRLADYFRDPAIEYIASDVETTGFNHIDDYMLCAGFSSDGKHVYVIPEHLLPLMNPLFQNKAKFVWHNGKFDYKFCKHANIDARVDEDTMLESYTLDEQRGVHDLEAVAADWVYSPNWKAMLDRYLPKKNMSYIHIPRPVLHQYMSYDIANTWNINSILRPKIEADPLAKLLYTRSLMPYSTYLAKVENHGALVDFAQVEKNEIRLKLEEDKWEGKLNEIAIEAMGHPVNPRSPVQMIPFLFDVLKIQTKERSTNKDVLKHLDPHPALLCLSKYRKVQKARGTYVTPILKRKWTSSDGCVHTTFLIHGTPTGRLASRKPNMQNIPRDPDIRGQFIARPKRLIIECDLNQAELRSLACLSGDEVLCKIYTTEGMSLHEVTRASFYGDPREYTDNDWIRFADFFAVPMEDITAPDGRIIKWHDRVIEEEKMRAKAVNFGIVYGREAPSLAEEFETQVSEAQRWINAWFSTYRQAAEFIRVCRDAPAKNKNLLTPFGRRKRVRVVTPQSLRALQNEAANFPHQSIAAEITNQSGVQSYEHLAETYDTYIWNTVHDSNLLDTPEEPEIAKAVIKYSCDLMERIPKEWGLTRIPFKAEAKVGTRWGHLVDHKKYFAQTQAKAA